MSGLLVSCINSFGQTNQSKIILNPSSTSVSIPADPAIFSRGTATANISVNYIGSNWTTESRAAFDYARYILEHTLNADPSVPIVVDAEMKILDPSIGGQTDFDHVANFSLSGNPFYHDDIAYPTSLANYLSGSDLDPSKSDIRITFNKNADYYYGTDALCPSDKHDFVSIALHELIHGLGFGASNWEYIDGAGNSSVYYKRWMYGMTYYPQAFDRFLQRTSGDLLTNYVAMDPAVDDFFFNNDLVWNGSNAVFANGGVLPKIFTRGVYLQGSTGVHLDDVTYDGTPNALMTHDIRLGEAIHNPGPIAIGILKDIGWDAVLFTGIEDQLSIKRFNAHPAPGEAVITNDPADRLVQTGNYSYYAAFEDVEPLGDHIIVTSLHWKLELFHNSGLYIADEFSGCNPYNLSVPTLPLDYEWKRDINGDIVGRIVVEGVDDVGYTHKKYLDVSVVAAPNVPILKAHLSSSFSSSDAFKFDCSSLFLEFYSEKVTEYRVNYRAIGDPVWSTVVIPVGEYSCSIIGLDESLSYEYYVDAINSNGSTSSEVRKKGSCDFLVNIYPNPFIDRFHVSSKETDLSPRYIEMIAADNANDFHVYKFDEPELEIDIDASDLKANEYIVRITTFNNNNYSYILARELNK